jgi:CRISPR-associated protein Csd1
MLGIEGNKDKTTAKEMPWVLAEKTHAAFKQFHLNLLVNQDDAGLIALRQFLVDWKPEQFSHAPFTLEHVDANVVFKLDGEVGYIHERCCQTLVVVSAQSCRSKRKRVPQRARDVLGDG